MVKYIIERAGQFYILVRFNFKFNNKDYIGEGRAHSPNIKGYLEQTINNATLNAKIYLLKTNAELRKHSKKEYNFFISTQEILDYNIDYYDTNIPQKDRYIYHDKGDYVEIEKNRKIQKKKYYKTDVDTNQEYETF